MAFAHPQGLVQAAKVAYIGGGKHLAAYKDTTPKPQ